MRLVVDARTSAFAALVDYAGVFPPASLDVESAVSGYRAARSSDSSWVAGRFLVRASQLTDLGRVAMSSMDHGEAPWEVSVIFDLDAAEAATLAADFHAELEPAMVVAAAEARIDDPTPEAIRRLHTTVGSISPEVVAFLEVNQASDIADQVRILSDVARETRRPTGSKLRCGGITPDLFPSPHTVASFIAAVVDHSIPFKATAGLHQPFRHFDPAMGVHRHGFFNLLIATTAASHGADLETIESIVEETDPEAFSLTAAFGTWRNLSFPGSAIRRTRVNRFIAYGSCDFEEPIEALEAIGYLGEGT